MGCRKQNGRAGINRAWRCRGDQSGQQLGYQPGLEPDPQDGIGLPLTEGATQCRVPEQVQQLVLELGQPIAEEMRGRIRTRQDPRDDLLNGTDHRLTARQAHGSFLAETDRLDDCRFVVEGASREKPLASATDIAKVAPYQVGDAVIRWRWAVVSIRLAAGFLVDMDEGTPALSIPKTAAATWPRCIQWNDCPNGGVTIIRTKMHANDVLSSRLL